MKNKKKQLLLSAIGVFGVLAIISGVTYAFFSYSKSGDSTNVIKAGSVKFIYTENNAGGRGISISDAMPMSDLQGKAQTGENNYFDFRVTAKSSKAMAIPYTITARVDDSSTLDPKVIKVWLSDQSNNEVVPVKFFDAADAASRSDVLQKFSDVSYASRYNERILYTGLVPANMDQEYVKNFRLRAWIDINTDFSPVETVTPASCSVALAANVELNAENCEAAGGTFTAAQTNTNYPYNGKTFKITVNVYANGQVVSENVTYNATEVAYTNANASGVTNLKQALDDLTTKLQ